MEVELKIFNTDDVSISHRVTGDSMEAALYNALAYLGWTAVQVPSSQFLEALQAVEDWD